MSTRGASTRLARAEDARAVAGIYGPVVETSATSFEWSPPTVEEVAGRMRETLLALPWLVREVDGRVVGYAYASRHRARAAYAWSVESSVFVAADARGEGHGSALYAALLEILALQGFRRCFAGGTLPDEPSVRLHESSGFQPVGVFRGVGFKHGRWHDVAWYQRALAVSAEPPRPPVELHALVTAERTLPGLPVGELTAWLSRYPVPESATR